MALCAYQCILVNVTLGGEHGLHHKLVTILLVGVVLKGLQAHWKKSRSRRSNGWEITSSCAVTASSLLKSFTLRAASHYPRFEQSVWDRWRPNSAWRSIAWAPSSWSWSRPCGLTGWWGASRTKPGSWTVLKEGSRNQKLLRDFRQHAINGWSC